MNTLRTHAGKIAAAPGRQHELAIQISQIDEVSFLIKAFSGARAGSLSWKIFEPMGHSLLLRTRLRERTTRGDCRTRSRIAAFISIHPALFHKRRRLAGNIFAADLALSHCGVFNNGLATQE